MMSRSGGHAAGNLRFGSRSRPLLLLSAMLTSGALTFVGLSASCQHREVATRSSLLARAAAAPAPVAPTTDAPRPGLPSSPDPNRLGDAVRWMLDEEAEKPPEWHVLLLDKTFETRRNTAQEGVHCRILSTRARKSRSLMQELPLTLAEARSKAEHARDHFFSVLITDPEWSQAIRTAQATELRSQAWGEIARILGPSTAAVAMAAKVLGKALEVVATRRAELRVEGMTCAACSGAVTRALEARQGVVAAEVNLLRQRASVDFDAAKVSEDDLCQLVEDIGFDASLVSTEPLRNSGVCGLGSGVWGLGTWRS
eukprot:s301_g23.t1